MTATPASPQSGFEIFPSPFPVPSKHVSGEVKGVPTIVTSLAFADKIVLTISQAGKLAHWVHVPLAAASANPMNPGGPIAGLGSSGGGGGGDADEDDNVETALLPLSHLTATTVLGGTKRDDEVVGQTLATTLASAILTQRPSEERLLIVGLGLENAARVGQEGQGRAWFDELLGLVLQVL